LRRAAAGAGMMQTAIDKLRELRALHEDGLLSRQEFDVRKNAILDAAYAVNAAAEPDAPARPGTEIGLMATQEVGPAHRRYRLERLIARGGMGEVWQATDLATHAELGHSAQVALKILPPSLTENALHAKLLIEEAARARQLAHQHIVRVYDWAQDPATGSYFIIMECLEGEDLDTLLAREGRLDLERALGLLAPLADALDHAWQGHGIVHRDIKPANVFVTRGGDVKLLDFGIAVRARAGGAGGLEAPASSGTAGYRAPEAAAAAPPSRALDVFSVAVMLVRMLTGALPAAGAVRPEALNDAQWDVLQSGFAPDPQARPGSVAALLDRLRAAQGPSEDELRARAEAARQAEEDDARQSHHLLRPHGVADDGKRLLAHPIGGGEVVGRVEVKLVDLGARNEALDVDRVITLDLDGLDLLVLQHDVLALADLVTLRLVLRLDRLAGLLVDELAAHAIASVAIERAKRNALGCRRGRIERPGA